MANSTTVRIINRQRGFKPITKKEYDIMREGGVHSTTIDRIKKFINDLSKASNKKYPSDHLDHTYEMLLYSIDFDYMNYGAGQYSDGDTCWDAENRDALTKYLGRCWCEKIRTCELYLMECQILCKFK